MNISPISFLPKLNILRRKRHNDFSSKPDTFEKTKEKGEILNKSGKPYNYPVTYFFRRDFEWLELPYFLIDKYSDYDKVNFLNYGCSRGFEAYTTSIILNETIKNQANKFYPIIAKDIKRDILKENRENQLTGEFTVDNSTKYGIDLFKIHHPNIDVDKYLKVSHIAGSFDYNVVMNKDIMLNVSFSYGNILDDVDDFDSETPTILMCRNMWPYVDKREYKEFCEKLYEKLADDSIVIIGSFDYLQRYTDADKKDFADYLMNAGFKPVKHYFEERPYLVFEKNKAKE